MPGSLGTGRCTVTRSSSGLSRSHCPRSMRNCTAFNECLEPSTATRILICALPLLQDILSLQLPQAAALAVAGIGRPFAAPGHLRRAVLELRDLAERVELRVGKDVGRRLVERERDENAAARGAGVLAHEEGNPVSYTHLTLPT